MAGAVVIDLQPGANSVRKGSIIPRGRALGSTHSTPEQHRYGHDVDHPGRPIIGVLGGRAAEALVFEVTTTAAETDLEHPRGIARPMVGRWGRSDKMGPVSVLPLEGDPRMAGVSDHLLDAVDEEAPGEADAYAAAGIERVPRS